MFVRCQAVSVKCSVEQAPCFGWSLSTIWSHCYEAGAQLSSLSAHISLITDTAHCHSPGQKLLHNLYPHHQIISSLQPGQKHNLFSSSLSTETVSELATVSEGENGSDDGPDDGEDIGGDMDVGLEDWHPGVVHCIKQAGEAVPDGEDGEHIPRMIRDWSMANEY